MGPTTFFVFFDQYTFVITDIRLAEQSKPIMSLHKYIKEMCIFYAKLITNKEYYGNNINVKYLCKTYLIEDSRLV